MPFFEFIELHPEFYGKHLQRYMDRVIHDINNGIVKGFENYPAKISKTLRKESKGKVKVDISKLNIPNA